MISNNSIWKTVPNISILIFAFALVISSKVSGQCMVLVELENGNKKALIIPEIDELILDLDSGQLKGFATTITSQGVYWGPLNDFYSWSQIKSITVPNRYKAKKFNRIYWSVICTGLFAAFATNKYLLSVSIFQKNEIVPIVVYGSLPIWGIIIPLTNELIDASSKKIKLMIEGKVKVVEYENPTRFPKK